MKILLTGASSFSGYWFTRTLVAAGHDVVAPLRGGIDDAGLRGERLRRLKDTVEIIDDCAFGSDRFLELVGGQDFDVLAHHGAQVTNYRSLDFDVESAVASNTLHIRAVLERMSGRGLKAVVATSSVFECDIGIGDAPLEAFSPYGLSKALTWQVLRFWTRRAKVPLGRFVIPNPFGPYEEPRFCNYLLKCWAKGETATVGTPVYIRDNIHVDLLALAYTEFASRIARTGSDDVIGPSGYVESQGAFAERLAGEMRKRLGLACELNLANQTDFSEPRRRVNTDQPDREALGWSESAAWDGVESYYRDVFGI